MWFYPNSILLLVRFEQRWTSCGANEVLAPKCHTAHSKPALTRMKTLETSWLNVAALYLILAGFASPEQKLSLPLAEVADIFCPGHWWALGGGCRWEAACIMLSRWKKKGSYGGSWWLYPQWRCTAPSCPSWAICPVFPKEPRFKISNCLEDAYLRHCCFVFVNTSASHPWVSLQHTWSHGLITPVTRRLLPLSLPASLYTCCLAISPPRGTCHILKAALML